jgi:acetyl-CoA C-acetyltransferase
MSDDAIVIVAAKRLPTGSFQGIYRDFPATYLGQLAIQGTLNALKLSPEEVDDAIMGCVLPAGQGQAPARQAALRAGLPQKVSCLTINKVCGSGLKSVMLAHDLIRIGSIRVAIAGGMESMTRAPYLLPGARSGLRMGSHEILDHMILDGLADSFSGGTSMGMFAEQTAEKYGFTREQQDAYAIESAKRAFNAIENGYFKEAIVPTRVVDQKEEVVIETDEPIKKVNIEKMPQLRPSFKKEGTVTAGNSSAIADGAATVIVMTEKEAQKRKLVPLARIIAHAEHSREPEWFTLAPSQAIEKVLKKANWHKDEVDLYEINEAFAVVVMAVMRELELPRDKVNVHGGACALGHPIGATGAILLTNLLYALKVHRKKRGVVSLCIGGGEAVAMAVESSV